MTLRARILSGFGFVVLLFIALGAFVTLFQRNQLIDQLDARLIAAAPLDRAAPPAAGESQGGTQTPPPDAVRPQRIEDEVDEPISDLYVADVFDDGRVVERVRGKLLRDIPAVDALSDRFADRRSSDKGSSDDFEIGTVRSFDDRTTFRVLTERRQDFTVVVAVPTTDVDQAVRQLILSFLAAAVLIAATLGILAWWVARLGLKPISAVTATARAIAEGERDQRAPEAHGRTEAAELATAFNVMLDERDEAENRLRRFVSDASHELRTPLTSIRGYLDLYAQGGFREDGQLDDAIRRMQSESARMASLVEDLLKLARLDEGQALQISPVNVGEMLVGVVSDAMAAHPGRSAQFDGTTPEELTAEFDAGKVQQLVAGLVDNALTHTTHATVVVSAIVGPTELAIYVVDDGPGLSPDEADRIFDRFYRTDTSRTRTSGGSGLGLSIAKAVADRHGGRIDLTTAPGEGCAFVVRLPLRA